MVVVGAEYCGRDSGWAGCSDETVRWNEADERKKVEEVGGLGQEDGMVDVAVVVCAPF